MIGSKPPASHGSVLVSGDNSGNIVNVNAENLIYNAPLAGKVARELPSFLSKVIRSFSEQSLDQYAVGARRELPAEVLLKIAYNKLPSTHPILLDYRQHILVLDNCYRGVEQQNDDARYLVRRKARYAYYSQLCQACEKASVVATKQSEYARDNSAMLITCVVADLFDQCKTSNDIAVEQETAHLAISLIVADALVECFVLESPVDVVAA